MRSQSGSIAHLHSAAAEEGSQVAIDPDHVGELFRHRPCPRRHCRPWEEGWGRDAVVLLAVSCTSRPPSGRVTGREGIAPEIASNPLQ